MDRNHREQRNRDNLNEKESDCKIGMDFRSHSHHHHDHALDVNTEVRCFVHWFINFIFSHLQEANYLKLKLLIILIKKIL